MPLPMHSMSTTKRLRDLEQKVAQLQRKLSVQRKSRRVAKRALVIKGPLASDLTATGNAMITRNSNNWRKVYDVNMIGSGMKLAGGTVVWAVWYEGKYQVFAANACEVSA